jgi:AcrR family transcriptional regulator
VKRDRLILQAAEKLFHERGFGAVGIDEIGERAGVTGPAIYRHVSGKDEILATLFDEAVDALLQRVNVASFEDPIEELRFLARAHAEFVIEHHQLASILIRDDRSLAPAHRRRHQRRERPYIKRWTDCIEQAYPHRTKDEATSATFASLHMLNSVGNWPPAARKSPELAALMADLVLGGIGSLADARTSSADSDAVSA